MVRIFVEGLPCAGKSLLIKNLEKDSIPIIHELGRVIPKKDFPGNGNSISEILEIDNWFLEKESNRMKKNNAFFDRSYLTHLVYAYAYGKLKNIPSFESTINFYMSNLTKLPIPDSIVYIDISPLESIKRQTRKLIANPNKALDTFWRTKSFLDDMLVAYDMLFDSCKNINICKISGYISTNEKKVIVKNLINSTYKDGFIDLNNYKTKLK